MEVSLITTIVVSIFASTGFWNFLQYTSQRRNRAEDMLLGLAHDKIYELCKRYIKRGSISHQGLDNLIHLYNPYHKLGGNGTCEELMNKVLQLPIVD